MSQLTDARNNEITGSLLDQIGGGTVTDPRPAGATLNSVDGELVMDLNSKATALFEIRASANSATYVFEVSLDGSNYYAVPARGLRGLIGATSQEDTYALSVTVTTTAAAVYSVECIGFRRVRCRVSSFTSGSSIVTGRAVSPNYSVLMETQPSILHVTATAAVNTSSTCTLPAVAGMFHYITHISLVKLYSVVGVAAGAGVLITSTNLPGNPVWTTEQLASAAGTAPEVIKEHRPFPLKSLVINTNTTLVAPAQTQTIWRWNVSYYLGA